jgi:hypothetical protein
MRHFVIVSFLSVSALLLSVNPAAAQFLGTFSWQTAPFCNVITVNVTQTGNSFALDGFDNLCGADRKAPVSGVATLNANGTAEFGLTIVNNPEIQATHLDVQLNVVTLGGTWSDSGLSGGTWVFNGAGGGARRPTGHLILTRFNETAAVVGRRQNGTPAAPTAILANETMLFLGARGHVGTGISGNSEAQIILLSSEDWTPTARGTRIDFLTTENGGVTTGTRMRIDHDGQVGIGVTDPLNQLDVAGDIRIGTGTNGCVLDRNGTLLTGVCSSDARFKRDVASFQPMLGKVAALRPVHFYWRGDEFPARGFGAQQSYGLMAQEVEEILPELVVTGADGYKAVNYSKLPLMAIQAIKELKAENDALRTEMERRIAALEARLKP